MSGEPNLVPRRMKTVGRFVAPDPWNGDARAEFTIEAYRLFNPGKRVVRDTRGMGLAYLYGISSELDGADRILPDALGELWRRGRVAPEALPAVLARISRELRPEDYRIWAGTRMDWWYGGVIAFILLVTLGFIAREWPKQGWEVAGLPRDVKVEQWLSEPMRVGHEVRMREARVRPAATRMVKGLRPPEGYKELQPDHEHVLIMLKDDRGHRLYIQPATDYDARFGLAPEGIVVATSAIGLDESVKKELAASVGGLDVERALWSGLYDTRRGDRSSVMFLAVFGVIMMAMGAAFCGFVQVKKWGRRKQMREWEGLARTLEAAPDVAPVVSREQRGTQQIDVGGMRLEVADVAVPEGGLVARQDVDDMAVEVGGKRIGLGAVDQVEAFYNTVSYRLEPAGWGTRFPVVLDHLYEGRVGVGLAEQGLRELEVVETELKKLPKTKAVWDIQDRRPRADSFQAVNHRAKDLGEYFIRGDGTPIVMAIREALEEVRRTRQAGVVRGGLHVLTDIKGWVMIGVGAVYSLLAWLLFPNVVLGSKYGDGREGTLIWPAGLLLALGGSVVLVVNRYPGLAAWGRRRAWVVVIGGIALLVGYLSLTWRKAPPKPITPLREWQERMKPAPVPVPTPVRVPTRPTR